jgi:hypothetical protein
MNYRVIRAITKTVVFESYNIINGIGLQNIVFNSDDLGNFTKFDSINIKQINATCILTNQFGNERGILPMINGIISARVDQNKQIYLNNYLEPNIRLNGNTLTIVYAPPISSNATSSTNGGFFKYVSSDVYQAKIDFTLLVEYI